MHGSGYPIRLLFIRRFTRLEFNALAGRVGEKPPPYFYIVYKLESFLCKVLKAREGFFGYEHWVHFLKQRE